jgi:hypothetical protein
MELNSTEIHTYEQRKKSLLVPDPWNDKFCKKNGLCNMYIESMLAQLMLLRAEDEPGIKINCPNPKYTEFHIHLHKLFIACEYRDNPSKFVFKPDESLPLVPLVAFKNLQNYIEDNIIHRTLKLYSWIGYVPDIRLLNDIDDAMSWVAQYVKLNPL